MRVFDSIVSLLYNILYNILYGLRQAFAAPKLLLVLWLANVLVAVPATLLVSTSLAESFGTSLVAEGMLEGFDSGWYGEYEAQAKGLETTFSPTVTGAGPMLDHLEAFWSGEMFTAEPGLVALGGSFALLWMFLLGGVLERLARTWTHPQERMELRHFSAAGGQFFARFCGLALMSGVLYFLVYRLGSFLYRRIRVATDEVTEETPVLLAVMVAAVLVVLLLNLVRMVFDYAKIVTVLEDRSNIFSSAWAGFLMVLRAPFKTLGVYFGFGVLSILLFVGYAQVAPGAGASSLVSVVLAFLGGQLYLVSRLFLRVGLLGGQMRLYRLREK